MELKYKTRGDSSPQGKPRVLFACHPEDHTLYFEDISKRILSHQNCAIWYFNPEDLLNAADNPAMEDVLLQLSEMQLFVFPVTTKLLVKENYARNRLIGFAEQKHIPVLPIMMEKSLEDVFALKFGDIQYLDVHNDDPTAIPFDEKLDSYLSRVLVGDELAERVRAAFDAYIFLSYRKKDRKYAQKLMRMIHSKPQYQNIAIWYDEYLVPGEDFNDAIKTALDKSDAFAMVVTPSLLENPNYVMEHEYPAARRSGKEIAAFEMNETDRELLKRFYEEIPECIKDTDAEQRESLFIEFLHKEALRETKNDPMHNFLIGLAYLDGIDVEVDHDKALTLITSAAESGESEALEKLVEMYHEGKGVERNYNTSMYWRERLLGVLRTKWEESREQENGIELIVAIWRCGDEYLAMGKVGLAAARYEEQLQLAQEAGHNRALSISYIKLGDIEGALGHPEIAKTYYEKSLEIFEAIAEEVKTIKSSRDLSISYIKLGDIEGALGHPEIAKTYYEKSLAIFEAIAEEVKTIESSRDLSISYIKLGNIEVALGHPKTAKTYYEKSLEIRTALAEEMETIESRRDISVSYNRLGDIERNLGHPEIAKTYYEKSLEILEAIAEEVKTIESRHDLSASYFRLGDIVIALGHPEIAKTYYEKSLAIFEAIAEEMETIESRRDISVSYNRLGDIERNLGHPEIAKTYYEKSLAIFEAIAEEVKTIKSCRDLSASYIKLGDIEVALGHPEIAKTYYEKSLEIDEAIAEEVKTIESRRDLSASYNRLGDIERNLGHPKTAKTYYEKSLEIRTALAEEMETIESRRDISVSYNRLGDIERNLGHPEIAKTYYEKSLEIFEAIAEEVKTIESRHDLSASYFRLGDIVIALGHPEIAKTYYEKSLAIFEAIAEEMETIESRRDISVSYNRLGDIERNLGHREIAKTYYEKSLAIFEAIAEEVKTIKSCRDLSASYTKLGDIEVALGHPETAKTYHEKALATEIYLEEKTVTSDVMRLFRNGYYSDAAQICIKNMNPCSISLRNNLAFLIRFGNLSEEDMNANISLKIPELLTLGVMFKNAFSLVNMALYCISVSESVGACKYFAMLTDEAWHDVFNFWYPEIWVRKSNNPEGALISLLANKADNSNVIPAEECQKMKDAIEIKYMKLIHTAEFNDLLKSIRKKSKSSDEGIS